MNVQEISVLGTLKRICLCHFNNAGKKVYTVMEALSKQDEENIEELIAHKRHIYFKNVFGQIIDETAILTYGEIDLNKDSDIQTIKDLKLFNKECGNWVPSSFNYKTATVKAKNNIVKEYTTYNSLLNFKYCHCRLGKPKRVIIYNIAGRIKQESKLQWT